MWLKYDFHQRSILISLQVYFTRNRTFFLAIAGGYSLRCFRTFKRVLVIALATFATAICLSFLFWPNPPPADAVAPARLAAQEMETVDSFLVLIAALDSSGQHTQSKEVRKRARRIAPFDERLMEVPK